jgi:hypothetical protein
MVAYQPTIDAGVYELSHRAVRRHDLEIYRTHVGCPIVNVVAYQAARMAQLVGYAMEQHRRDGYHSPVASQQKMAVDNMSHVVEGRIHLEALFSFDGCSCDLVSYMVPSSVSEAGGES